jgi:hypothetical protein
MYSFAPLSSPDEITLTTGRIASSTAGLKSADP